MSGVTITGIFARQIYDSRGNPTVEVDVTTQQGQFRACVPSGASTGEHEAIELRDKDEKHHGKGVTQAVNNVNTKIGPEIIGMDPRDQQAIDTKMIEMDGTPNKGNFGANAILGVSLAVARAGASANGVPLYQHIANLAGNPGPLVLPVPAFNIINGGSHAGNKLYMQEFMMLPTGAQNFREAMQMGSETYHHLKKLIKAEYGQDAVNVGDEGGFAPNIQSPGDCWRLISQAVANAGYTGRVKFGMDVAASEFFTKETNTYNLNKWNENPEEKDAELNAVPATALADIYKDWIADPEVPIATIEDGFAEDDWGAWREFEAFNKENGDANIQTVGDDLLVTNVNRMEMARAEDGDATKPACNALLLKVNQIGSLTEAINAVKFAKENGWGVMTSHRSGETEDTFIADLAVGLSTGQIKTGAPCRSERMAKYNQLMRIEEELDANAVFAGENFRRPSDWLFPQ